MDLKGKVAIVTGASLGIGLSVTEALIRRGVRVSGFARDAARLRRLAQRLGEAFEPQPCDVADLEQVGRAVLSARDRLGGIDILINNAGVGRFGAVDRLPKEEWDELIATNVSGLYHCIREVVPTMKAQGRGHIVNVASIAGLVGYPEASGYNATKFAVRGMSEALLKELGAFGIKVTALYPGSTDTGFGGRTGSSSVTLQPGDIAAAIVHVLECSEGLLVSEMVLRPFP